MSMYFCNELKLQMGAAAVLHWSQAPSKMALLAVAMLDNSVNIFSSRGTQLPRRPGEIIACPSSNRVPVAALAWHPDRLLLAVAWVDGSLLFVAYKDNGAFHYRNVAPKHDAGGAPVLMKWLPDGGRVMIAFEKGDVVMWCVAANSNTLGLDVDWEPTKLEEATLTLPGTPCHIVFAQPHRSPNAAINDDLAARTAVRAAALGDSTHIQEFFVALSQPSSSNRAGATATSAVYMANDAGGSRRIVEIEAGLEITGLFWNAVASQVVCVTSDYAMTTHAENDGAWSVHSRMKFAGPRASEQTRDPDARLHTVWAGAHTLVSAAPEDSVLRMFNFDTHSGAVLPLLSEQENGDPAVGGLGDGLGGPQAARVTAVAYHEGHGLLAVALDQGQIRCFQHTGEAREDDEEPDDGATSTAAREWHALPAVDCSRGKLALHFGPTSRVFCVTSKDAVTVCEKVNLQSTFSAPLIALQSSLQQVAIHSVEGGVGVRRAKGVKLLGLDMSNELLAMWDEQSLEIFLIQELDTVRSASVAMAETPRSGVAVVGGAVYRALGSKVEILSEQAVVKDTVEVSAAEGRPEWLASASTVLAVLTSNLFLRTYSLKGRTPKELAMGQVGISVRTARGVLGAGGDGPVFGPVAAMHVAANGRRAALLCAAADGAPGALNPRLVVHDTEIDATLTLDFSEHDAQPLAVLWAAEEPKMLAVHLEVQPDSEHYARTGANALAVVFVASKRLLLHDVQALDRDVVPVALHPPFFSQAVPSARGLVPAQKTLACFAGMEDSDASMRSGLIAFTLHMASGSTDAALNAMKAIKDPAIWSSMAKVSIRLGRLDVLELCLANMENLRAARALRDETAHAKEKLATAPSRRGDPKDKARQQEQQGSAGRDVAALGVVAVHLGLTDDATSLFKKAGAWDKVNALLQAQGRWKEAIAVARDKDRIHLRATLVSHARQLEQQRAYDAAAAQYEAAGVHAAEVTRMYLMAGQPDALERYVTERKSDAALARFWGQYLASQGRMAEATTFLEAIDDTLSQVKLLCERGDIEGAKARISDGSDKAAAFYLARRLEALDRVQEAIKYYGIAARFAHGAALARRRGLWPELRQLAMQSDSATQLKCAEFLLSQGETDHAAALFQAAGAQERAIKIAMDSSATEDGDAVLSAIAADLTSEASISRESLLEFAERFKERGQWGHAARVLVGAGRLTEAAAIVEAHGVPLDEAFADKLTPAKGDCDEDERAGVLRRIAKAARKQGLYQLAAKKYSQCGDKVKAMKALLHTHDNEKIILFANASRSKDIYLMAAQYLQSAGTWLQDPALLKTIMSFLTKAKSPLRLAHFQELMAQAEIDECRDYARAEAALGEALKQYSAAHGRRTAAALPDSDASAEDVAAKIDGVKTRLRMLQQFQHATNKSTEPGTRLEIGEQLVHSVPMEVVDGEACIRIGDVYALIIETYYRQEQYDEALKWAQDMEERGIYLAPYLDEGMLTTIYERNGLEYRAAAAGAAGGDDEVSEDEVDEDDDEVDEDIDTANYGGWA